MRVSKRERERDREHKEIDDYCAQESLSHQISERVHSLSGHFAGSQITLQRFVEEPKFLNENPFTAPSSIAVAADDDDDDEETTTAEMLA